MTTTATKTEPLTPMGAIELLATAVEKGAIPKNSTECHWRQSLNAVLRAHPDFDKIADLHSLHADEFIRPYVNKRVDSAPVTKDRVSRFRSAYEFILRYHRDPLATQKVTRTRAGGNGNGGGASPKRSSAAASNNGASTLQLREGMISHVGKIAPDEIDRVDRWVRAIA